MEWWGVMKQRAAVRAICAVAGVCGCLAAGATPTTNLSSVLSQDVQDAANLGVEMRDRGVILLEMDADDLRGARVGCENFVAPVKVRLDRKRMLREKHRLVKSEIWERRSHRDAGRTGKSIPGKLSGPMA